MFRLSFTLDTNAIIDLEEGRAAAQDLQRVICAWRGGGADLAVVAISGSERRREGGYSQNFAEFEAKLRAVGLDGVDVLLPMMYLDVGFLGEGLLSSPEMEALEQRIHEVLFPGTPLAAPRQEGPGWRRWVNRKCDVQAMWTHIWHRRGGVFVTRDENFHGPAKSAALVALGAGRIATPEAAAALLVSGSGTAP